MHSSLVTRTAALTGLLAAPALAGCGGAGAEDGSGSGTRVVASFYPLAYVAERVAGEQADVVNLTKPGQEPHDLELSVEDTAALSEADVVVYENGLMPAVDEAVEQSGADRVLDAAEVVDLAGEDPHFWLDPQRMATLAGEVGDALSSADPDSAAAYAANVGRLQGELRALDRDYRQGLADCRIQTVVVSHDAFGYLGLRYGFEVVGIAGLSPDAEPSPARLRELRDLIEEKDVTTVFSEELVSPELAQTLARGVGVETAVLDPIEGLSDDTADQDYLSLMRRNLAALEKANRCR